MPNGKITLYNKTDNTILVELDLDGIFNIEDNLNDSPSNAKFKVITSPTYREDFEVNTVIYHSDTNSWWVIKSDESSYLQTNEYEHEISAVEYLEFYSYKHLPNCAFAPNTYTLEQMLERLFYIAKLNVDVVYPAFLDKDKVMPFMSFENYTVANALKNIGRVLNAIPKMFVDTVGGYTPTLTFVNRSGLDTAIVNDLDTQFPVAYEKNMNSSDQFLTRSISNITNAKSSNIVVAPLRGGFKSVTPNSITYDANNAVVFLPSKVDSVEFVRLYVPIRVSRFIVGGSTSATLFEGYYTDEQAVKNAIIDNLAEFTIFTLSDLQALVMPNSEVIHQINLNDTLGASFPNTFFRGLHTLKSKFDFDTSEALTGDYNTIQKVKDKTIHWLPFENQLILGKTIRDGMETPLTGASHFRGFVIAQKTSGTTTEQILISPVTKTIGFFQNRIPNDELLVQVGYYPISDIKISVDNDNDSQDERFYNQQGKVIDVTSVSRLITAHTNDSVEGVKLRNRRYQSPEETFSDILPLGQLVRDSNQIYVVSQRSLDCQIADGNEYYNVIYTLTNNRIGRSENIIADSAVINYKTPDSNLVSRTQLYKDYIELSLSSRNNDNPYLSMSKAFIISNNFVGTRFDYTVLAKSGFGPLVTLPDSSTEPTTMLYYVKNPSVFDLYKSKLMNVDWQDNNFLGFRLDSTGITYVQTPILYTDNLGGATNFELLFLDTQDVTSATTDFNTPSVIDELAPFTDLTRVDEDYYNDSVITEGNFTMRIQEPDYDKDPFEIPVFEYMIQANDDYDPKGNVIVSSELFTEFVGEPLITYHYVISSTRFTAENADKIFTNNTPSSSTDKRVVIDRASATQINLTLFSTLTSVTPPITLNATPFNHIGIYAYDVNANKFKFLFAINDYTMASTSAITLYINNWRI